MLKPLRVLLPVLALAAVLVPGLAQAQPTDVFISEYIEGSSNNKAIEIYNGTGAAINLATGNYVLQQYFNGSVSSGLNISLTGTVASGDVYVVAHASASATILAQADQTSSSGFFNGDDAIVLRQGGTGGAIVDSIGQIGTDPGTEWGTGLTSTADNTLRRKTAVCQGDTNASDAFNPATEWDGFATDTFGGLGSHTATCGGGVTLSIDDVSAAEGNSGTTTFTFTVSLSAPAGAGGVSFDIATADNSATVADNDYATSSLTGQTIPFGSSTYTFDVTVNGDTTVEPNQTFFVNVTNVTGATVVDGQGQGTISNDDVALTPIHDIQGPGASSPVVSSTVTTTGIVTGVRSNGFFIQEPDASVDADPATSEGILVFTSSAPPAAAAVGALVQVTGTVAEFVPGADLLQPPLTELTSPTVVQLSTGNPLPAPIPLTTTFPDPAGVHDQLERLEGMRVSVSSLTVVGPTLGSLSEANATSTSTGVFYGVVTGVPRPFREAGIPAPDPAPSGGGTIPPIPRFDSNPERIRVDSDGQVGGPLVDAGTGAVVTGLVGPLDYTFRTYTILPDPGAALGVSGGPAATAVTAATGQEFTVASYNMQRFFDTVNDPGVSDVALTAAAFDRRLAKASLAIRDFLRMPDVVGVAEVENLTTLQTLAARISTDAIAAAQPDPQYAAYLVEGNDIGGIDVGFLVKTAPVFAATPRVEVVTVQQESAGTLFVNPDASTELLNDRPPLRLNAIVHHPNGASFPVTVIANHLRSLGSVNSEAAGSNGWPTAGARVRAKRQAQAEDLANLVQARQVADPAEHIILLGDFNAFEVNDGLGHSMGVISGTPAPDNETAVPGDGVDLVNPDFDNLFDSPPPAERYSYVFDGNAQNLDHILVNAPLDTDTSAHRAEHARVNADFPETARNDGTTPVRLSDHDPVVAFFQVAAFAVADLSITKAESADPVTTGTNLAYTITVDNAGPDPAAGVSWSDTLPAGTTFVSLAEPGGWSCTTPAVGAGGTVSCSIDPLGVGNAVFTLTVLVDSSLIGTDISNTATVTSTTSDPDLDDLSATETTTVAATRADLSVTKMDTPDPVTPGTDLTYTITVANAGPDAAAQASLSDTLPAGTTFVSLSSPGGWSCTTPAVGAGGTVSCSLGSFAVGSAVFTLVIHVDPSVQPGTEITNAAGASSATPDPEPENEIGIATTTVGGSADLSVAKVDTPDPVAAGTNLTYTITVTNAGPNYAGSVVLNDPLPAGTTFQSLSAPAGWSCAMPAVLGTGAFSCSTASFAPGSAVFTLTVAVGSGVANGTMLTNTATVTSPTPDLNTGNESASATTTVTNSTVISATKTVGGQLTPGGAVTYTVVLTNTSGQSQADNPGAEFTDVLPAELTLVSATATSGTAVATVATNTVTWNGPIPGGGSVTLTIDATLNTGLTNGTQVSNQGSVAYDADGNGTNEASAVTDDPAAGGAANPTTFIVGGQSAAEIPTLNEVGLALLVLLLALGGAGLLRRGRA